MGSDTRSPWEAAIENLTGPWDLLVISAGVAAAAVAAALGPWSVEDVLPVGAFGAMAILKGVQAIQVRRGLRRRANAIATGLSKCEPPAESQAYRVKRELRLWENHITTNAEFSKLLDQEAEHVRTSWKAEFDKWKKKDQLNREKLMSRF